MGPWSAKRASESGTLFLRQEGLFGGHRSVGKGRSAHEIWDKREGAAPLHEPTHTHTQLAPSLSGTTIKLLITKVK